MAHSWLRGVGISGDAGREGRGWMSPRWNALAAARGKAGLQPSAAVC